MRGQTSLEFLIYVAIAAASTAVMLKLYLFGNASIAAYQQNSSMEQLAGQIALQFGQQSGSFYAYLPMEPCNLAAEGASIIYTNRSYPLPGNISINRTKICGMHGLVELYTETAQNGTLVVS